MKPIKTILDLPYRERVIKELKDKISELEMRLYIQKLHCKLFHRQKFTTWISSFWWGLTYFKERLRMVRKFGITKKKFKETMARIKQITKSAKNLGKS